MLASSYLSTTKRSGLKFLAVLLFGYLTTNEQLVAKRWDAALPRIATWAQFIEKSTLQKGFHLYTHFDHRGEITRIESVKLINTLLP